MKQIRLWSQWVFVTQNLKTFNFTEQSATRTLHHQNTPTKPTKYIAFFI